MLEEADLSDTEEGSKPIRNPLRIPEITNTTADLLG